jgi:urease accessory protein
MNLRDAPLGWHAQLELAYSTDCERTVVSRRRHTGPLVVQKAFYPEGPRVCHSTLVHPPGGIAGGDRLELQIAAECGAHAVITTPGAAKWYRSVGPSAQVETRVQVHDDAMLEWLPQPGIVFDGAQARQSLHVRLGRNGRYIGWDILCLGRIASGERFANGRFQSRTEIVGEVGRLWSDSAVIRGGDPLLSAQAGLAGRAVTGLFLAGGPCVERELVDRCRAVPTVAPARSGVTCLPSLLAARFIGDSTEAAWSYFTALWTLVRPALTGRVACAPRIWQT